MTRWRRNRSQAPAKLSHRQKGCIKKKANPLLLSILPSSGQALTPQGEGAWNWAQFQGASMTQLSHLQDGNNGTASSRVP